MQFNVQIWQGALDRGSWQKICMPHTKLWGIARSGYPTQFSESWAWQLWTSCQLNSKSQLETSGGCLVLHGVSRFGYPFLFEEHVPDLYVCIPVTSLWIWKTTKYVTVAWVRINTNISMKFSKNMSELLLKWLRWKSWLWKERVFKGKCAEGVGWISNIFEINWQEVAHLPCSELPFCEVYPDLDRWCKSG